MLISFEGGVMCMVYSSARWWLDQPTVGSGRSVPLLVGIFLGVGESVGTRLFIARILGGASVIS